MREAEAPVGNTIQVSNTITKIGENVWRNIEAHTEFEALMKVTENCSKQLTVWNPKEFGYVQTHIKKSREALHRLQTSDPNGLRVEDQKAARDRLHCWLEREEIMWN